MSHAIVDTNVPIVANGHSDQASRPCAVACQQLIAEFSADRRILVIDSSWKIIQEYKHRLNQAGQPGIGDAFLRWVLTNWANPLRCEQVLITPTVDGHDFAEFPDDPALERFDRSDRKFVAVSHAHPAHPPIFNAVDTDWLHYQDALAAHGVRVEHVCPNDVRRLAAGEHYKE
jgi:hypothetical protein